jgi:hypothetical protein
LTINAVHLSVSGQTFTSTVSGKINKEETYLFYLHGAIVQEMGIHAVSEEFGKYEFIGILDTLSHYGYHVISEVRPKGTDVVKYAEKVSKQIDILLAQGVQPENIVVVGASQGAYITVEVANLVKNPKVKYAILALCNDYNINYYAKYSPKLCGNFLSIYEETDQKKSCQKLLANQFCKTGFKEIKLNMGNGHGFIFKPYPEWTKPLVQWINKN